LGACFSHRFTPLLEKLFSVQENCCAILLHPIIPNETTCFAARVPRNTNEIPVPPFSTSARLFGYDEFVAHEGRDAYQFRGDGDRQLGSAGNQFAGDIAAQGTISYRPSATSSASPDGDASPLALYSM
jgi:hypothetical protein